MKKKLGERMKKILCKKLNRITVRYSEEEYEELKEQADVAALTISEYVRRRILGKRVVSKLDLRVLAELRRIGGLLKHVHVESGGAYSKDTAACLQLIESYILTINKELDNRDRERR